MGDTRYALVSGEFLLHGDTAGRRRGFEPDGDSLAFRPTRPELLRRLGSPPRDAHLQPGGRVQVRLEGIDALELHYRGSHQKRPHCLRARAALLEMLGFARVVYQRPASAQGLPIRVSRATPHPVPGYVLVRQVDPNGRPVVFAFAGDPGVPASRAVRLSARAAAQSVNARLLEAGHAYPAYYRTLPDHLRGALSRCVARARTAGVGIWAVDKTNSGVRVTAPLSLTRAAIWPKLYRRLSDYLRVPVSNGNGGVAGFLAWLQDRRFDSRDDAVRLLDPGAAGVQRLSDLLEVQGSRVRLRVEPGSVVLMPR